jgi:hypothetical protein
VPELGSATVQVWARHKDERRGYVEETVTIGGELVRIAYPPPPKPWLRDWIRGLWKGWKGELE